MLSRCPGRRPARRARHRRHQRPRNRASADRHTRHGSGPLGRLSARRGRHGARGDRHRPRPLPRARHDRGGSARGPLPRRRPRRVPLRSGRASGRWRTARAPAPSAEMGRCLAHQRLGAGSNRVRNPAPHTRRSRSGTCPCSPSRPGPALPASSPRSTRRTATTHGASSTPGPATNGTCARISTASCSWNRATRARGRPARRAEHRGTMFPNLYFVTPPSFRGRPIAHPPHFGPCPQPSGALPTIAITSAPAQRIGCDTRQGLTSLKSSRSSATLMLPQHFWVRMLLVTSPSLVRSRSGVWHAATRRRPS